MPATLTRTVSGLLLQEGFEAANGWTAETGFSRVAEPTLVTWGKVSPTPILSPGAGGTFDRDGVREPVPIIDGSTSYISYDAGNGTTGWRPCIAVSTDRFRSIDDRYPGLGELDNGASGTHAAVASGWLSKWGSTWVAHRITCSSVYGSPKAGLPAGGYGWDIWTASAIDGTYTYVRTVPLGTSGTWCDGDLLPCSYVYSGGTYYHFPEGSRSGEYFKIGIATSSTPSGAVTLGSDILEPADYYGDSPENNRAFRCVSLGVYAIASNLIYVAGGGVFTNRNAVAISSSISDWSSFKTYITQSYRRPCDGADVVGVATPFTGPDGETFEEDGYIPGMFDTDPTDGNHIGRKCYGLIWESSSHGLSFSDATTTRYRYYKSFSHTNFVAEFAVCFPTGPVAGSDVSFEFRSNGSTGYRAVVRNDGDKTTRLEKMDGTTLSDGSGLSIDAGVWHTIRVQALDNALFVIFDGQAQCAAVDASYGSGTQIAFSARKCDAVIRLLSIYSATEATFRGLSANSTVWLRTHGGDAALPVMAIEADNSGIGQSTAFELHWPQSRLEWKDGEDVQADDRRIWGGDVFEFYSGIAPPAGGAGGSPVFGSD